MNFLEGVIFPPRPDHLILAKLFLVLISVVFVSFFSLLFGGTSLSLIYNRLGKSEEKPMFFKFSKDLLHRLTGNFWISLLLVLLPVFTLMISYGELLYDSNIKILQYFSYFIIHLLIGLVLVYWYKGGLSAEKPVSGPRMFSGVLGVLFLLGAAYIFVMGTTLVLDPEKWGFIKTVYPFFFYSMNSFARFFLFLTVMFGFTGVGILFLLLNWNRQDGQDENYRKYVRRFGVTLALSFTFLQPVFFLWNVVNLPMVARSFSVYASGVVVIVLLFLLSLILYNLMIKPASSSGSVAFVFFILVLFGYNGFDHFARETALREHNLVLLKDAQEAEATKAAAKAQFMPKNEESDLKIGENLFKTKCSACHRFDMKVVGPAYKDVLPKYKGHMDKLAAFILNPVKVNPALPPMPNQGLTPKEAQAAAKYIMHRFETEFEHK